MANPHPTHKFKKGESGNPGGRPKRDWTWAGVLQEAVEAMAKDGQPIKKHIANSLLAEALKGNVMAQKELMNRMDGMPNQQTDMTTDGEPLRIMFVAKPIDGQTINEDSDR